MFYKKLKFLLRYMFNTKIKFRFPTHKKVLIYDNASLRILNRLIDIKKTFILSTRFVSTLPEPEIIYLPLILKVLFSRQGLEFNLDTQLESYKKSTPYYTSYIYGPSQYHLDNDPADTEKELRRLPY